MLLDTDTNHNKYVYLDYQNYMHSLDSCNKHLNKHSNKHSNKYSNKSSTLASELYRYMAYLTLTASPSSSGKQV